MHLTVLNGTPQQRQWVADALKACTYDFATIDANVSVNFSGLTSCKLKHTYMCTNQQGPSLFEIQIEDWADNPRSPNNQGLPDVYRDLHEFFIEAFIHELGHVVCFFLINTTALQGQLASCFVHRPDGRRGTLNDYIGTESTQHQWADLIVEAVAEWFRLAFLPRTQIYQNRTNWDLSPADFKRAMALLLASDSWEYGEPILCATSISFVDEGTERISTLSGVEDVELKRISAYNPSFYDPAVYAGEGGENMDWAFDYEVVLGAPTSFATMVNDQAGAWGGAGPLLVSFISAGDNPGSGTDFYFVDELPPPTDIIRKPTQPWASHVHLGSPPLTGDLDARSWWTHVRALVQTLTLPTPRPDWGQLEISFDSQIPGEESSPAPGGSNSSSLDIFGAALPDFSDDPPPWGSHHIDGSGPFPDGLPSPLDQGWVTATAVYSEPTFHSQGSIGQVRWLKRVSNRDVTPPADPGPLRPTSTTSTGDDGINEPATYVRLVSPLGSGRDGVVYNISPDRASYEWINVWTGPMSTVDYATTVQLSGRFFPVKRKSGGSPPPFPSRFAGNANAGPQGGGSIRSAQEQLLAARQLQIANRISGGGSIKPS